MLAKFHSLTNKPKLNELSSLKKLFAVSSTGVATTNELFDKEINILEMDILQLHKLILEHLAKEENNKRQALKEEFQTLSKSLQSADMSRGKLQTTVKRLEEIRDNLIELDKKKTKDDYLARIGGIIEETTKSGFRSKIDLTAVTKSDACSPEVREMRVRFLSEARRFVNLPVRVDKKFDKRCPACMKDMELNDSNEMYVCLTCGFEKAPIFNIEEVWTEDGEVEPSKDVNKEVSNMLRLARRLQGRDRIQNEEAILEKLTIYFSYKGYYPSSLIKSQSLNPDGKTRGPYSKSDMTEALKTIGHDQPYWDGNRFCHLVWGWNLPSWDDRMNLVAERYKSFLITSYQVIHELDPARSSTVMKQYVLYCILNDMSVDVSRDDLELPQADCLATYEYYRQNIYSRLGWNWFKSIM